MHTLLVLSEPLMVLLICGLTVILWLLPREYLDCGFFFAPVIGLTLFASVGLFLIGVLLVPLNALEILLFVGILLLATAWLKRENLGAILNGVVKYKIFAIVPLTMLLIIAIGTRDSGLSFLSAGQDEIQYVNNSTHILKHLHTSDALDIVIPRVDHWAHDAITLHLTHNQSYRRGAEIFLAGVMAITGENSFVSFTIAGIVAYLCFLLVIPSICNAFLGMNRFHSILTQVIFALSHLWIMLLLQGSLANLCSLSLFLLAATAVPRLFESAKSGAHVLVGFLLAGPIIFYNEVAFALLLTPLAAFLFINYLNNKNNLLAIAKKLFAVLAALVFFSHIALFGLAWMTYVVFFKALEDSAAPSLFSLTSAAATISPIYGIYTYYSTDPMNNSIAQFVTTHPLSITVLITSIYTASIHSFFRKANPSAKVLGAALSLLIITTLHSLLVGQAFMLVRSVQYAFGYTIVGLVLAISLQKNAIMKSLTTLLLTCLIGINLLSVQAVVVHLKKYDDRTDPTVFRYSPHSQLWTEFLSYIDKSESSPVLITGYNSTAKPLLISSLIEPRSNYLGEYIRSFWKIMTPLPRISRDSNIYGIYGSNKSIFAPMYLDQLPDINTGIDKLNRTSKHAVVMSGSDDPVEWETQSLISRARERFFPIGDIIDRNGSSALKLIVDDLVVPAGQINQQMIRDSLVINFETDSSQKIRAFEAIFEPALKEGDIQSIQNDVILTFNGDRLTVRPIDNNSNDIYLKVMNKKGVILKRIFTVNIH